MTSSREKRFDSRVSDELVSDEVVVTTLVGFVGRLVVAKGGDVVVEAVGMLASEIEVRGEGRGEDPRAD